MGLVSCAICIPFHAQQRLGSRGGRCCTRSPFLLVFATHVWSRAMEVMRAPSLLTIIHPPCGPPPPAPCRQIQLAARGHPHLPAQHSMDLDSLQAHLSHHRVRRSNRLLEVTHTSLHSMDLDSLLAHLSHPRACRFNRLLEVIRTSLPPCLPWTLHSLQAHLSHPRARRFNRLLEVIRTSLHSTAWTLTHCRPTFLTIAYAGPTACLRSPTPPCTAQHGP